MRIEKREERIGNERCRIVQPSVFLQPDNGFCREDNPRDDIVVDTVLNQAKAVYYAPR